MMRTNTKTRVPQESHEEVTQPCTPNGLRWEGSLPGVIKFLYREVGQERPLGCWVTHETRGGGGGGGGG